MDRSGSAVLLTPITPAPTGNGLAMRAGMLLDALAEAVSVDVVVVPVSGAPDNCFWTAERARSVTVIQPVGFGAGREHTTRQLADPELRDRLGRTAPLPLRAALAPPTLAPEVVSALPDDARRPDVVVVFRTYLAPLGVRLARELGAPRVVIDADDDDATLLRALGDDDEAAAHDRLARCWLPDADVVTAASAIDADALAARVGVRIAVLPNAVDVPASTGPVPGADRLLFLGNLTYEPNRAASRELATEILPAVREVRPAVTLDLVGRNDGSLDDLGADPGVRLGGSVPDVAPAYADADVVVVPLRHGAGTRIKVLEAFAHRRPVVATHVAVSGLDVEDERELLLGESPDDLVKAILRLLDDAELREAIVVHAGAFAQQYSRDLVARHARRLVLGA